MSTLVLSACVLDFPEEDQDGVFACESDSDCVSGFFCFVDRCRRIENAPPDAGASDTGPVGIDSLGNSDTGTANPRDATSSDVSDLDAGPAPDAVALDAMPSPDAQVHDTGAPCNDKLCGGDCVDVRTSSEHCGACNRTCGQGACIASICRSYVVAENAGWQPDVLRMSPDGQMLYWTNFAASGGIYRKDPLSANPASAVALGQRSPVALELEPGRVYWSTFEQTSGPRPGHVRYLDLNPMGRVMTVTTETASRPQGLAVADGRIFWNDNSPLDIRAFEIGSQRAFQVRVSVGSSFVNAVRADSSNVYWFDSAGSIYSLPWALPSATTPETVVTGMSSEARAVADLDPHLYWGESINGLQSQNRIFRVHKTTRVVELLAQIAPGGPDEAAFRMDVRDGQVWLTTERVSGGNGRLFRVPMNGGSPVELIAARPDVELRGIATTTDFIFWGEVERGMGRVMGMRKP